MSEIVIPASKYRLTSIDDPDYNQEPLGLLCIWEGPRSGRDYVIGVDPSDGVGQDRSAVEVCAVGDQTRPDEQVAEWCGHINPYHLSALLFAIGKLYSIDGREPLMAIEINRGDTVQMDLRLKYDWSNFYVYRRTDRTKVNWASRYGWYTSAETRPKLLARGIQQIKERRFKINSPWLAEELADFEYDEEKQKMKAATGCYDDRVMSAFIALYCSRDWSSFGDAVVAREDLVEVRKLINPQTIDISSEESENMYSMGMLYY